MGSFGGKTILWQEGDYRIIEDMEVGERWMERLYHGKGWIGGKTITAEPIPEKIIAKALDYGIVLG